MNPCVQCLRVLLFTAVVSAAVAPRAQAQDNRIDAVTPMAPELAAFGTGAVGVRTITVTDKNRPDILRTQPGGPTMRYDRSLVLEVWYPAAPTATKTQGSEYRVVMRDPAVTFTLRGRATRDAPPLGSGGPFPLLIISHGYPGDRFLLSHLGLPVTRRHLVFGAAAAVPTGHHPHLRPLGRTPEDGR